MSIDPRAVSTISKLLDARDQFDENSNSYSIINLVLGNNYRRS